MKIIAHRGWWMTSPERNTQVSFVRALDNGFGIETDIRDMAGTLVISHDPPQGGEMTAQAFFDLCAHYPQAGPHALNIKSDGLQTGLKELFLKVWPSFGFVFDMSVPDGLGYLRVELPTYTRLSEYEVKPPFLAQAHGVWLDAFHSVWYGPELIEQLLADGKEVCLVSPELHCRDYLQFWASIKSWGVHTHSKMRLCTDFPHDAQEYFHA